MAKWKIHFPFTEMEKQKKKERKKERHGKAENQAGTSPQGLFKKTGLSWTLPGSFLLH